MIHLRSRRSPSRFVHPSAAGPGARSLARGLTLAFVPSMAGANTGTSGRGRELMRGLSNTKNGCVLRGEAQGVALSTATGFGVGLVTSLAELNALIPSQPPFSAFAYLLNRDTSSSIQCLVGCGAPGASGWSFQFSYGAGHNLGLTRWGVGDAQSSLAWTVNGLPNACGIVVDGGSTFRFFLDGRFATTASAGITSPTQANSFIISGNTSGTQGLQNASIYVVYVWSRALQDNEMMALRSDPWRLVRPQRWVLDGTGTPTASPGGLIPAFIGM